MSDPGNTIRARILAVDDDPLVLDTIGMLLEDEYDVVVASSGAEAIQCLQDPNARNFAVVVLDIKMPQMDGLETAEKLKALLPMTPIIFHTGYPGDYREDEIEQINAPFDYIEKGASSTRLLRSVRNAVENYESRMNGRYIVGLAESNYGLVGQSPAMREVYRTIQKVSRADIKVMILGETGTGKELVARAIHLNSSRRHGRLGIVNCNHKSTELVESELFGHKKGAFTGAFADRKGLFEIADGGTVFLDEIGDLSSTTQIALLRVLESGEFQQMGPESEVRSTDVRIICATHCDLGEMVSGGRFREDLYYRLRGATIVLPPLRERREDIPLLLSRIFDRLTIEKGLPLKVLHPAAMNMLIEYDWPGNVRELVDVVEALVVLSDSELIMPEDVNRQIQSDSKLEGPSTRSLAARMRSAERTCIIQELTESGGNITRAAEMLQIDRSNLSKKIKLHEIDISLLKTGDATDPD